MSRSMLMCIVALGCVEASGQTTGTLLENRGKPGVTQGAATTPAPAGLETQDDALRRQLLEAMQAGIGQMSPEQLRRVLAVVEGDSVPLPPAAEEVLAAYRQQAGAIQQEANRKIAVHRRQAIADLREIQNRMTRDGKLDEALTVRDLIRSLTLDPVNVQPDPGNLLNFRDKRGRPLYFRLTGSTLGSVWGTDTYTDDSALAAAAVHAGALRNGQTGIVKVTVLTGRDAYTGSARNGVTTSDWGSYSGSYRVEPVRTDDEPDLPAEDPDAPPGAEVPPDGAAGQ